MTGSGKSQTPDVDPVVAVDNPFGRTSHRDLRRLQGRAGADIFRNFPQVVAVISNMAEKKSLDRFADTLRGEVARREARAARCGPTDPGQRLRPVAECRAARDAGDLPPMPTLFVVADEFHADADGSSRSTPSCSITLLRAGSFVSGSTSCSHRRRWMSARSKDIDKNTSYRIGLSGQPARQCPARSSAPRTPTTSESAASTRRRVPGTAGGRTGQIPQHLCRRHLQTTQGRPFFVVPTVPEPQAVHRIGGGRRPGCDLPAPRTLPSGPPRKLIATIGEQLAGYGPRAPPALAGSLDEPIPLAEVLQDAAVPEGQLRWPLGEIDRPVRDAPGSTGFDARSAAGNLLIHGGPKSGEVDGAGPSSLSAAATARVARRQLLPPGLRRRPTAKVADLARNRQRRLLEPERIRRTFGELEPCCDPASRGCGGPLRSRVPGDLTTCTPSAIGSIDQFNTKPVCWPR